MIGLRLRQILVVMAAIGTTISQAAPHDYLQTLIVTNGATSDCTQPYMSDNAAVMAYRDANGGTPRIMVDNGGGFVNITSGLIDVSGPRVSHDGKFVAFYGTNGSNQGRPYVYNVALGPGVGNPTPLPVGASTTPASSLLPPGVSDEIGGYVYIVFEDMESILGAPKQIRLYEYSWTLTVGRTTVVVSNDANHDPADDDCESPIIRADATEIAFVSNATNLMGNNSGFKQVFLTSGSPWVTNEVISQDNSSAFLTADSSFPAGSSDLNIIAFQNADGDDNIYVRDRSAPDTFIPYDVTVFGAGNRGSYEPTVSADGNVIAFSSWRPFSGTAFDPLTMVGLVDRCIYAKTIYPANAGGVIESFRDGGGGTRYRRGGAYPCLNGDGSELLFQSNGDRLVGSEVHPTEDWIYWRHDAVW